MTEEVKYIRPAGEAEWFVVFDKRRTKRCRWWHWVADYPWSHVYLLKSINDGLGTLIVNPLPGGIIVLEQPLPVWRFIDALDEVTAVLWHRTELSEFAQPRKQFLYSCIGVAKAVLHVEGLGVQTPYRLYERLLGMGAKKIR
jgi:hypothetical protein